MCPVQQVTKGVKAARNLVVRCNATPLVGSRCTSWPNVTLVRLLSVPGRLMGTKAEKSLGVYCMSHVLDHQARENRLRIRCGCMDDRGAPLLEKSYLACLIAVPRISFDANRQDGGIPLSLESVTRVLPASSRWGK